MQSCGVRVCFKVCHREGVLMRNWEKLFIALGFIALFAAAPARAEDAAATVPAQKAMQELSTKMSSGQQNNSYACPVGSGSGSAGGGQDLSALSAVVNAQKFKDVEQKWRVSKKNLPPGNYRDRCFGCLTMPDEDGERQLSCVCPGKSGMERIAINLEKCKEGAEITYCGSVLVCGTCMYTEDSAANNTKSDQTDRTTDLILRAIAKEKK